MSSARALNTPLMDAVLSSFPGRPVAIHESSQPQLVKKALRIVLGAHLNVL
jgi:hypothetical protein